jgi:phage terminase small subunit
MLNGSAAKHPERMRQRENEPKDDRALGPPPDWLSPEQDAAWAELAHAAPWATFADRIALEMAAVLLAAFRAAGASFAPPLLTRLETLLGRLGLTPSDRSRVSQSPPTETNPFSAFARRGGQ